MGETSERQAALSRPVKLGNGEHYRPVLKVLSVWTVGLEGERGVDEIGRKWEGGIKRERLIGRER
jgi:hypothetical protein